MDVTKPEALRNALMQGEAITPAQLDAFIAANPKEGPLYDYKSGAMTDKARREKGLKTIREWVTGFANAEGGVLIIGPDEEQGLKIVG